MENIKIINNLIDKFEDMADKEPKEVNKQRILKDVNDLRKLKKEISIQNILQNNLKKALTSEMDHCKSLMYEVLYEYFYKEEAMDLMVVFSDIKRSYYHIKSVVPILENIVGTSLKDEKEFFKKIYKADEDLIFIIDVYFDIAIRIINGQTKNMWALYKDNEKIFNLLKGDKK
jgi:hypothetical protein